MAVALRQIEQEGTDLIRHIATREPAKVIALRTGITPRHVYNLREDIGQPRLAWPAFIAMAHQYPELRSAVARWLNLSEKDGPQAEKLLDQIRRMVETMPEEGDQA